MLAIVLVAGVAVCFSVGLAGMFGRQAGLLVVVVGWLMDQNKATAAAAVNVNCPRAHLQRREC